MPEKETDLLPCEVSSPVSPHTPPQPLFAGDALDSIPPETQPAQSVRGHGAPHPKPYKASDATLARASVGAQRLDKQASQKIIEPLQKLLKKEVKWEWSDKEEQAFTTIKHLLTTAPILACPDFGSTFQLETDASDIGLEAVLTQTINGENYVIAFASRGLNGAEQEKYKVFDEFGSRKGDPRIQKLAEEKRIFYGLPTMEEIRRGLKEKKQKEEDQQDKEREERETEEMKRLIKLRQEIYINDAIRKRKEEKLEKERIRRATEQEEKTKKKKISKKSPEENRRK
ncbi:stress response protein NST1-like [Belonocnema kinseyi]|uniref:stress response protein NST1-like n=1 Tax=Belonocnema kinseyi TaxID=2817044 RepID=UPI00143DF196|nr:stress response protein NST1-like [Belonocnema kinseyi]